MTEPPELLLSRWRRLAMLDQQSEAEKRASLNGLGLFFGALVGANLGALQHMEIRDYLLITMLVYFIVLYIQIAPISKNRLTYIVSLLALSATLFVLLVDPFDLNFFGSRARPTPHLFVTIGLWLVSLATIELRPVQMVAHGGTDEASGRD